MLNRTQILSASDRVIEKVDVPEWKGHVFVRSLTGAERDIFEDANLVRQQKRNTVKFDIRIRNAKAHLVVLAACDEAGEPIFEEKDVAVLSTKSAAAIDRIYDVAARLSGITKEVMDDLMGNSAPDQNESSTSG